MSDILKPCPFCGGKAEFMSGRDYAMPTHYYVYCTKCYCRTPIRYDNEKNAIKTWNRRIKKEVEE